MNWSQLKTILWLRWQLTRHQWARGGGLGAVIAAIIAVGALVMGVASFVGGVLVGDWGRSSGNKSSSIKSRVTKKAWRNHSVLILHETNKETIKALPGIIDWYHSHGYRVVTVSKLMDSK